MVRRAVGRSAPVGWVLLTVLALALAGLVAPTSAAARGVPKPILAGWMPYWTWSSSMASYTANADLFTDISPFWHDTANGGAPGQVDITTHSLPASRAVLLDALRASGKKVIPSVTDGTTSGWMASVLRDPGSRSAHVGQLVDLVVSNGYDGIDLDYEHFAFHDGRDSWPATAPAWGAFVTELADALHARGKVVTAAVPTSAYWVYDFPTMGRVLDRVRVMTYDYSYGTPGPVAPLWWVQEETTTMLGMIPGDKLMMGVPTYGRDWARKNSSGGYLVTNGQGQLTDTSACPSGYSIATRTVDTKNNGQVAGRPGAEIIRDPASGEVRVRYGETFAAGGMVCTIHREAWLADTTTVFDRVRLAVDLGAAGAAMWTVGGEDPNQWGPLREFAATKSPHPVAAGATVKIHTGVPEATVAGNLTVTETEAPGFLTAWPCDQSRPNTSVANYGINDTTSAYALVRTDSAGDFCVFTQSAAHILWDLTGVTSASAPKTLLDTRTSSPLAGGTTVKVNTRVPGATVAGTVTVFDPAADGYLTVWSCSDPRPDVTSLTYQRGQPSTAFVAAQAGSAGEVCLYTTGPVQVAWQQIQGLPAVQLGQSQRLADTRPGAPLGAGGTLAVATGKTSTGALGTLTVVNPQQAGSVTVWRCGDPRPAAISARFEAGRSTSAFVAAGTAANGNICVYTTAATHLVWDQVGTGPQWVDGSLSRLLESNVAADAITRVHVGRAGSTALGYLGVTGGAGAGRVWAYECGRDVPVTPVAVMGATGQGAGFAAVRADGSGDVCLRSTVPGTLTWDAVAEVSPIKGHVPQRTIDTRERGARLAAETTLRVPTGAPGRTVWGTLTVTGATIPGYSVVWPCDQAKPTASTSNFMAGQAVPNMASARADARGDICVSVSQSAHVLWDQVAESDDVTAQAPVRDLDTRTAGGPVAAGGLRRVDLGAPGATAVLNVTTVAPAAPGFTTIWPCAEGRPNASITNYQPGQVVANAAMVRADGDGAVCIFSMATTHVVLDRTATTYAVDTHRPLRLLDTRLL